MRRIICSLTILILIFLVGCTIQEQTILGGDKEEPIGQSGIGEETRDIDILEFNQYVNNEFDYSINYPSDWKQTEMELPNEPILAIMFSPETPQNSYFAENVLVGVMDNEPGLFGDEEDLPYKEFIEIGLKVGKDVYDEDYSPIEEIYISGHQAYKYTVTKERDMYILKQTTINMLIGDRTYMVIASTTDLSSTQEIKETELILNSFRLK